MSAQADIDAIVEALVEQRIADLAASVRARSGQMVVYDPYESTRDVLRSHGMRQVVTPTPVVYDEVEPQTVWWRRWCTKLAVGLVTAAAVIEAVSWVVDTYLGGIPGLLAVCTAVLLAAVCCRAGGGRGRTFSGTFEGRFH